MTHTRKNSGVCSSSTQVEITSDGKIESVVVLGGCDGNLKGVCTLLKGMDAKQAIQNLKGISCGPRPSSCPDQIALAIEEALAQ